MSGKIRGATLLLVALLFLGCEGEKEPSEDTKVKEVFEVSKSPDLSDQDQDKELDLSEDEEPGDLVEIDEGDDRDEGYYEYYEPDDACHLDCFGGLRCRGREVEELAFAPLPCEYDECLGVASYACEEECWIEYYTEQDYREKDPYSLCGENEPNEIGDPCSAEAPCTPQWRAFEGWPEHTAIVDYLTCDLEQGVCVEGQPPEMPDFGASCGLTYDNVLWGPGEPRLSHSFFGQSTCSSGSCALSTGLGGCLAQGCTLPCERDQDCPLGSYCPTDWREPEEETYCSTLGATLPEPSCECGLEEEVAAFAAEGATDCGTLSYRDRDVPLWACIFEEISKDRAFFGFEATIISDQQFQAFVGNEAGEIWMFRYEWDCCGEDQGPGVVREACLSPSIKTITAEEATTLRPEGARVLDCAPNDAPPEILCEG